MTGTEAVVAANARTNRWMRRLALIIGALLLLIASTGLGVEIAGLRSANRARHVLLDCTTPGPKPPPVTGHACFDRGVKTTAEAVNDLRRSTDCVALYAIGNRPPACADVDARMDDIRAGNDPFARPPTPTPGGS